MMLPLPFDSHLAAQLRLLIDPCEVRAVKRYVRNPASEIQLVVLVQDGYALEEVAAVFASPGSGEAVCYIVHLHSRPRARAGINGRDRGARQRGL